MARPENVIYTSCLWCTAGNTSIFQLMEFDQSEFFGASGNRVGLDKIAYVYVPTACQNGSQGMDSFDPQFG